MFVKNPGLGKAFQIQVLWYLNNEYILIRGEGIINTWSWKSHCYDIIHNWQAERRGYDQYLDICKGMTRTKQSSMVTEWHNKPVPETFRKMQNDIKQCGVQKSRFWSNYLQKQLKNFLKSVSTKLQNYSHEDFVYSLINLKAKTQKQCWLLVDI